MKIYITRHSKTLWNEQFKLQGWKDSPLTLDGKRDALCLKDVIKDKNIDSVYSSPLNRAYETAQIIFPKSKIIKDKRLMEMNFGIYEGRNIRELKNNHEYHDLWNNPSPNYGLPGGETYQQVIDRFQNFIDEKYKENPNQTIFITIHGMLFTIVHGIALNLPVNRFNEINGEIIRGCSLSLFEYKNSQYQIQYLGKDDYLDPQTKISYK